MKTKLKVQLSLGLVCLVLGFFITLQFKSVTHTLKDDEASYTRTDEVVAQLKIEQQKNEELQKQLASYEDALEDYETNVHTRSLEDSLSKASMLAGTKAVTGSGITVILQDSQARSNQDKTANANQYLVHDEDLLKVVNELFAGGAEAVAVNENRLVATTAIRCAGPVILVNDIRLAPPYEIKAIGDPQKLQASLQLQGGVVDYLTNIFGFEIKIQPSDSIFIPAFDGAAGFKYASPTEAPQKEDAT